MTIRVIFFSLVYFFMIGVISLILKFLTTWMIYYAYDLVAYTLLTCIVAYHTLPFAKRIFFNQRISVRNKAVFITGCDTGFGHALAKRLDAKGFRVFASCLAPDGDGAKALKESCSDSLHVIGLNVTKDLDVKAAVDYVKKNLNEYELWAVVNNAGIAKGFELDWTPVEDFQVNLDVNALGVVRVTKAFLPLLQSSKGRVVTITSVAGRMCFPSLCAYGMSKYAAACFCDCLRLEMHPWGIKVITIEPENFKTGISDWNVKKLQLDDAVKNIDEDLKEKYDLQYFQEYRSALKLLLFTFSNKTHRVVDDLENAVTLEEPCNSYPACRNIIFKLAYMVGYLLPTSIQDLMCRFVFYILGFPQPKTCSV